MPFTPGSDWARRELKFSTEFRIDGYQQAEFVWYQENTLVSATASLKFLNTTTDLRFGMAVDEVTPDLQQLDGSLAFTCRMAGLMQDDALFGGYEEIIITASLTAYVLCYEPRPEMPPSGSQRTPWATLVSEKPYFVELKKTNKLQRSPHRAFSPRHSQHPRLLAQSSRNASPGGSHADEVAFVDHLGRGNRRSRTSTAGAGDAR